MSRLLLVCPEPLGHGQPAGVGVRFLEMAKVLCGDDHHVTVLSPDRGAVDGCSAGSLDAQSIALHTAAADAAIVQGHAGNALFAHGRPVPTVVDLYDPYIIENLHYYATRGAEVFHHDHATFMQSLVRGDIFLCASYAQRMFYLGLLLAAERLNPVAFEEDPRLDSLLRIVPFGVQPPRPEVERHGNAVLFGGIYDWYDPILAIDAVAVARRSLPDISLTFSRHPNPELTPQGQTAEAMEYVSRHGYGDFVRFEEWTPYEKRGSFFDRFRLALLTFPRSIETDLAMRTRVYDYLWGGLPVITCSAPGTDEILNRYQAGVVVANPSADAFATQIVLVLSHDAKYNRLADGAVRFVAEHQWPHVLRPLREFCRNPQFDRNKEGFVRPPSLLDRLKRRIGGAF